MIEPFFSIDNAEWLAPATRREFERVNGEIADINSALAAAEFAARKAKAGDAMTLDVDLLMTSAANLTKARIAAARAEVALRQSLPSLFSLAAENVNHAIEEAQSEYDIAIHHVRSKLVDIGFGELLAVKNAWGFSDLEAMISMSRDVAPVALKRERVRAEKMTPASWQQTNRIELTAALERLRRLIDAAAVA